MTTTLEEFWTAQKPPPTATTPPVLGSRGSALAPCVDCGAPMHRRRTPEADRAVGSKFFGSLGRCSGCDSRHRYGQTNSGMTPCKDCAKYCRGERCRQCATAFGARMRAHKATMPGRRRPPTKLPRYERYTPPVPSEDTRPLTREERLDALCIQVDTEIFFGEMGSSYAAAETVCAGCPIAARCLAAGMDEEFGFFASSPPYRKRLRREMRAPDVTETAA